MINTGEAELLELLREIDNRLAAEKMAKKVDLFVLGGAAAVIAYGSPRGTVDIDAYLENKRVRELFESWAGQGKELALKHGVYYQNANISLMLIEDPDWRDRSREILKGKLKNLRVKAISKEDLILSKISRYNDRDREDIRFLTEKHKIEPKKLIAYYKSARQYYVGDLRTLDQTFNIVLGEHFGHKPLPTQK
jgi:hypothetical protein